MVVLGHLAAHRALVHLGLPESRLTRTASGEPPLDDRDEMGVGPHATNERIVAPETA